MTGDERQINRSKRRLLGAGNVGRRKGGRAAMPVYLYVVFVVVARVCGEALRMGRSRLVH